jgi:hypothetical protein
MNYESITSDFLTDNLIGDTQNEYYVRANIETDLELDSTSEKDIERMKD